MISNYLHPYPYNPFVNWWLSVSHILFTQHKCHDSQPCVKFVFVARKQWHRAVINLWKGLEGGSWNICGTQVCNFINTHALVRCWCESWRQRMSVYRIPIQYYKFRIHRRGGANEEPLSMLVESAVVIFELVCMAVREISSNWEN